MMPPPLSSLPVTLKRSHRMTLEAIGVSSTIIGLDVADMRELLAKAIHRGDVCITAMEDRLRLFRSAWSVVDRLYYVERALRKEPQAAMLVSEDLRGHFDTACAMRNGMDHPERTAQVAAKAKAYPLFGLISYAHLNPHDLSPEKTTPDAYNITILSTSTSHQAWSVDLDHLKYGTIGLGGAGLRLHAFDEVLDLAAAATALDGYCRALDGMLDRQFPGAAAMAPDRFGADQMTFHVTATPLGAPP
uniref:hypothetical protein n=1 Tax=uncultured Caulobacter sp. TaxID=158749 RepID=UPI0025E7AFF3|nr:hypothetical protein [uncultured Caulobacter sp.]